MDIQTLKAERRSESGSANARRLRRDGKTPAILYGHGEAVVPLALPADDVAAMLDAGHHVVSIEVDGKPERALVKDIQFDTWQAHALHVDFTRVGLDETVTVMVELKTHGEPKAALSGGVIERPLHQLEVECAADSIPDEIIVEIGDLEMNASLHVRDLLLPEGVKALADADAMVVVIHEPRAGVEEDEEEVPAEAAGSEEPEVIGRVAKAEEDGAGEDGKDS